MTTGDRVVITEELPGTKLFYWKGLALVDAQRRKLAGPENTVSGFKRPRGNPVKHSPYIIDLLPKTLS